MESSPPGPNAELIVAASEFAAAVKEFNGDPVKQRQLLKEADRLRLLLETPMDVLVKQWEMSQCIAAMNLLVELDVLEAIPKQGSISSKDLAEIVKVDESAIGRALKLIVAFGIGVEPAPNVFALNANAFVFLKGAAREFFQFMIDQTGPFLKLPEYFRTHKQEDLYDLNKSPYAWAVGMEGQSYYDAISSDPRKLHNFDFTMATSEQVTPILGMFPWASMKEQVEADTSRAFVVDIGGGRGQLLKAIQKEAPNGFGAKMILQDRPDVLASLTAADTPGIEKMPYDFFTPQPVKSMAFPDFASWLTHTLQMHIFCKEMVKNIASAMGPTSRFIIADMIMPEKVEIGTEVTPYWMDFNLMMLNGTEKSKKQFEEILDAAGLEIVKIYPFAFGCHTNIECRLKTGGASL
ncbi:O-methyltransferase [Lachnellula hyalina]|uniref:O-methyltransferase n=1 Tax=Lachnellula hyalina TaxID=1316788 RepID=A0A8H8R2I1_9HELO|nr:O-methyltransferase [Lachnellula hyalina]TVY27243.1 O-methyltransferase [Lachnellula hyalina]